MGAKELCKVLSGDRPVAAAGAREKPSWQQQERASYKSGFMVMSEQPGTLAAWVQTGLLSFRRCPAGRRGKPRPASTRTKILISSSRSPREYVLTSTYFTRHVPQFPTQGHQILLWTRMSGTMLRGCAYRCRGASVDVSKLFRKARKACKPLKRAKRNGI